MLFRSTVQGCLEDPKHIRMRQLVATLKTLRTELTELFEKVCERSVALDKETFFIKCEDEVLLHKARASIAAKNVLQGGRPTRIVVVGVTQYKPDEKPIK